MVFITLSECPCGTTIGVQETVKLGGPLRSADFCYYKFKNVSKAGVRVSTEINLFEVSLIIAITSRSLL